MTKIIEKTYILLSWIFFIFVVITVPLTNLENNNGFLGWDKLVHFFIFGILATLTASLLKEISKNKKFFSLKTISGIIFIFCSLLVILGEYLQKFIPGRFPSTGDVFFGILGIIVAILITKKKSDPLFFLFS